MVAVDVAAADMDQDQLGQGFIAEIYKCVNSLLYFIPRLYSASN